MIIPGIRDLLQASSISLIRSCPASKSAEISGSDEGESPIRSTAGSPWWNAEAPSANRQGRFGMNLPCENADPRKSGLCTTKDRRINYCRVVRCTPHAPREGVPLGLTRSVRSTTLIDSPVLTSKIVKNFKKIPAVLA